jgi:exodeoxyribonuclease V alpha subunit
MIIYNKYKLNTNDVIDSNLYQLIEDIKEITFKKVDYIALKNNYSREDDRRVVAAILSTMEELCFTLSHCYLTFNLIYKYTVVTLGNYLSEELLRTNLGNLALSNKVINIDERYYLKEMFDAERVITDRVGH